MTCTESTRPAWIATRPFHGSQRLRLRPKCSINPADRSSSTSFRKAGLVVPYVELEKRHRLDSKRDANLLHHPHHVVAWKHLLEGVTRACRPARVQRRHLGGHIYRCRAELLVKRSEETIAVSVTVGPCGVEEVAVKVHGTAKYTGRSLVISA